MNALLFEIPYVRKQTILTQKWLAKRGSSAFTGAYETLNGWCFDRRPGAYEINEQTGVCEKSTFETLCALRHGMRGRESLVTHVGGISEYRLEVIQNDVLCDFGSCSFLPDSEVIQQATGLLEEFDGMDLREEYVRHYVCVKLELERI